MGVCAAFAGPERPRRSALDNNIKNINTENSAAEMTLASSLTLLVVVVVVVVVVEG